MTKNKSIHVPFRFNAEEQEKYGKVNKKRLIRLLKIEEHLKRIALCSDPVLSEMAKTLLDDE